MIVLTILAVVGFFISLKSRYDATMTQLEAERTERAARTRSRAAK
jgi:hypothetical protein